MLGTCHILIVDDSSLNRELFQALLECQGHTSECAVNGVDALQKLSPDFDLVLMDVQMPDMDGYEATRRIRQMPEYADLPVIMVTALSSKEDRLCAVQAGANDFIAKPVDRTELQVRMASLLKMKRAQDALKRQHAELEVLVQQRTAELQDALNFLVVSEMEAQQAHRDTIDRLVVAAEYRDENTALHVQRVSQYCVLLAQLLQMGEEEVEIVRQASAMHDVGKIGVPDSVLLKPGRLTPEERQVMEQHTLIGARILGNSSSHLLQAGEAIALTHHEKWDGSGYPHGLAGEEIPLYARICAVADVFDALTTSRSYKPAFPNERALEIMREGRGKHFDPTLLDLFLNSMSHVEAIQQCYGLEE